MYLKCSVFEVSIVAILNHQIKTSTKHLKGNIMRTSGKINTAQELLNYNFHVVENGKSVNTSRSSKLALAVKTGFIFIQPQEILKIESFGNQSILSLVNGEEHVATRTLKEFEAMLGKEAFMRVHKCFIVNLEFVKRFDKEMNYIEMEDGSRADVSRRKKEEFFRSFQYA